MSPAEKAYATYMAVAVIVSLASFLVIFSPSFKKMVSLKLVTLALITTPVALLFLFVFLDQMDAVGLKGLLSGNFMCSGLHGGGYRVDCSLFEVLFEGAVNSIIFSFISFGLVPLAVFSFNLLLVTAVKKYTNS